MPSLLHTYLRRQDACDRQRTGSILGAFHFWALETCGGKYSTELAIRLPEILATKTDNPKQGCKQNRLHVTESWHKAHVLFPLKEVGPLLGHHPDSPVENRAAVQCKRAAEGWKAEDPWSVRGLLVS